MGGCAWEGVYGRVCMGECAWEGVHGKVCMGGCACVGVHGRVCMGGCVWESVYGRVCMGGCAWEGVHGRVCMGGCACVGGCTCGTVYMWDGVHVWEGMPVLMFVLSPGHHSFELHTFEKPFHCDACNKLLYGCYFQGYLCTGTELVCCLLLVHTSPPSSPPLPTCIHTDTWYSMQENCP